MGRYGYGARRGHLGETWVILGHTSIGSYGETWVYACIRTTIRITKTSLLHINDSGGAAGTP